MNEKPGKENENIFGNIVEEVVGREFFTKILEHAVATQFILRKSRQHVTFLFVPFYLINIAARFLPFIRR